MDGLTVFSSLLYCLYLKISEIGLTREIGNAGHSLFIWNYKITVTWISYNALFSLSMYLSLYLSVSLLSSRIKINQNDMLVHWNFRKSQSTELHNWRRLHCIIFVCVSELKKDAFQIHLYAYEDLFLLCTTYPNL